MYTFSIRRWFAIDWVCFFPHYYGISLACYSLLCYRSNLQSSLALFCASTSWPRILRCSTEVIAAWLLCCNFFSVHSVLSVYMF